MYEIVGYSQALRDLLQTVSQVSRTDGAVLIEGETGVGKDLVARRIHQESSRSRGPFIAVDCAALSGPVADEEAPRGGFLAAAHDGTLFFDEIGDLPLGSQNLLLALLQGHMVSPLDRLTNVRVIAATNIDLARRVQLGKFRMDLFYRLNATKLRVPPLRERRDDIPSLAVYFLRKYQPSGRKLKLSEATRRELFISPWPGNVRELENCIHRAALLAKGNTIRPSDLYLGTAAGPLVAKDAARRSSRQTRALEKRFGL